MYFVKLRKSSRGVNKEEHYLYQVLHKYTPPLYAFLKEGLHF
jgi:hypothetical protein